ncbi:MAG: hypothetical protein FWC62_06445 [Firmicutes bacterium]|nr:hypothetical protein [Bacillota bacterium]
MKKKIFAALCVFAMLTVLLAGCHVVYGDSINCVSLLKGTTWTVTASFVDGHESRTVDMSADNLAALKVDSTNSAGTISLKLTQGSTTRTVDISNQFSGNIDTSGFTAGKVDMRVDYKSAKDIKITINW